MQEGICVISYQKAKKQHLFHTNRLIHITLLVPQGAERISFVAIPTHTPLTNLLLLRYISSLLSDYHIRLQSPTFDTMIYPCGTIRASSISAHTPSANKYPLLYIATSHINALLSMPQTLGPLLWFSFQATYSQLWK